MKKEERQNKIEQLINKEIIATQEELLLALQKDGIKTTQATLSRDIREMQIVKEADGNGNIRYTLFQKNDNTQEEYLQQNVYDTLMKITQVEFMNIIQTTPRNANALAAIIDEMSLDGIVGTLAGYDTVVVISDSKESAKNINQLFLSYADRDLLVRK
ncbi:arginine repressor [Ligilactobacillus ceti]|uniref:Arginine repressor n=1 Tax=Ligilactobacillus ceti DSM 22408 TaxID=1122146 RepID=A0A0R2KPC0_9LACO|nr:arginine repressor [Ligilactobacillus ceti]KRN88506.1 arginine repressor [Ligilactobacillus ceti DSM 22408]